ncbi:hypothetical protein ACVWWO_006703 [Bradyrhizobium sp. F1.13.1]
MTSPTRTPTPSPTGIARGTADRGRHHGRGGERPGHRQIDLRDQDHDHHAGRDDPEERTDLQLLQKIGRRQQGSAAETGECVNRTRDENDDDERRRNQDRAIVAREAE